MMKGKNKIDVSGTIKAIPTMSEQSLSRLRLNIAGWMNSGDPAKQDAAARVSEALDALTATPILTDFEALPDEARAKKVRTAFLRRPATETEARIINVLLLYPGETSAQLSARLGWEGQTWHAHFGAMCHAREDLLWSAPKSPVRGVPFYSNIFAEYNSEDGTWRMRPELVPVLTGLFGANGEGGF